MLKLEKINGKNIQDILNLHVSEEQKGFVAENSLSMAEAFIAVTNNGYAFPFGIYDGEAAVGFLMIGFDKDDDWEDAPGIACGNYSLWRLMIDKRYQGKGYGRGAAELALQFIRTFPCGKAEYCWVSYEAENEAARHLYSSLGFSETGEKDGDELIAVLTLQEGDQV